jgi:siroheme synthase
MNMIREIEVDIQPTPKEIAREVFYMTVSELTEFINELGKLTPNPTKFGTIMQEVANSDKLTHEGKLIQLQNKLSWQEGRSLIVFRINNS